MMSDSSSVDLDDVSRNAAQQVKVKKGKHVRAHRSKKSIFPQKLWRMVNDQRFQSAIRWTEDGQSFLISESSLRIMCLGKENNIFYTQQPKSFVRQLHLYGFRKISKNQFMHTYFRKEQPQLLKFIKRSYRPSLSARDDSDDGEIDRNQNNDPMIENNNDNNNNSGNIDFLS